MTPESVRFSSLLYASNSARCHYLHTHTLNHPLLFVLFLLTRSINAALHMFCPYIMTNNQVYAQDLGRLSMYVIVAYSLISDQSNESLNTKPSMTSR